MKSKRDIGFEGEKIAKEYLMSNNLEFIFQNYYTKYGEIDLIFLEKNTKTLIFIEVKYRKNSNYGDPLEVIDNKKIDRIVMSSKIYLSKNKWKNSVRYDIIGITKNKINEKMVINWIKNAF